MALHVPDMCFWPAMTRKKLELFEMHTCLLPGAQIWFRRKWRKLVTASTSLDCIDGYRPFRYWNDVFYALFRVLDWFFLVFHFEGNVCFWIPKVIWPRMDWFWGFLFKNCFFRWPHVFMDWNLKVYLFCFSFWRFRFFSMFRLRGILVCCLKMLVTFNQKFLYYRLESFSTAMQLYFLSFRVFHCLCFFGSVGKFLWLLL